MQKKNNKETMKRVLKYIRKIYTGTGTLPVVSRPDCITDLIYPYPHR